MVIRNYCLLLFYGDHYLMVIENGDAIVSKIFMSGDQNLRDKHILNNNSK